MVVSLFWCLPYQFGVHKIESEIKGQEVNMVHCCYAKRALKISNWHNFVTIQDTDKYVTSF